ncbi:RagB/SusD family nutrient uptake outer membrane protein [Urechidicola croceus]|uniref:RagB/SusD family nutrient uptake outer membrane protein n=1 Tax=Urechidicola croceus TaxID=1850246 RepID=A0A1D8PAE6_9FLAO|nr:RagB/SusD family nutrient uptake outer membrane protein [Urechidicola croceus]AOW21550.1 RagB/SusD family nutrient uptake outer membrane protein [Urechidicola croceus]
MKIKQIKKYLLLSLSTIFIISCTNLEIEGTDSIIDTSTDGGFDGVEDVESSLTNIYNGLNRIGDQANIYAISEVSTDELLIPTRGTDWGDNGIWRTLHQHTWDANHQHILTAWNNWNSTIFGASEIIDSRSNANAEQIALASFARAYAMFIIMDNFGQVPFRAPDEGPEINPMVMTRPDAMAFVLADLDVAIAGLPNATAGSGDALKRGTKAAARFLKAKVLLNAHVYDGTGTADTGNMNEVVALVDAIAADGFAIEDGYFDIFKQDADNETIWWLPTGVGNRIWNGMHYSQGAPGNDGGGWNGFTTLSEFYDLFEGDANTNVVGSGQEERRGWVPDATNADESNYGIGYGFLIGKQYGVDGQPKKNRAGADLEFTRDFPGLVGNNDATGIRTIKYHPINGAFTEHEIVFRYADAHLMKAEAIMRGASGGDALTLVNELRTMRDATPLSSLSETDMIDERGRELYKEMWRRNDLIRFGQYTKDWEFKSPESIGDETKNLFPIPSNAILSNPNLMQNPGY